MIIRKQFLGFALFLGTVILLHLFVIASNIFTFSKKFLFTKNGVRYSNVVKLLFFIYMWWSISSLGWLISNFIFMFNISEKGLTLFGNLAYLFSIETLYTFIFFNYVYYQKKNIIRIFNKISYILFFISIVLVIIPVLIFKPLIGVVITANGFRLIASKYNIIYSIILLIGIIILLLLATKVLRLKAGRVFFYISFGYFLITTFINLVFVPLFGSNLWWVGPTFLIYFSIYLYSIIHFDSAFSLNYYTYWILFLLGVGAFIEFILRYLFLLTIVPLGLVTYLFFISMVIILMWINKRNRYLAISPYLTASDLLFLLVSYLDSNKGQKTYIEYWLNESIAKIINSRFLFVAVFPNFGKRIVLDSNQGNLSILNLADPFHIPLNYVNEYTVLFQNDSFVKIYIYNPIEITVELKHFLDLLFKISYMFFLQLLTSYYLQDLNEQLENRVKDGVQSLIDQNRKLRLAYDRLNSVYKVIRRSDEAKTMFLSIVSHQLRTPLSVMQNYIDMLESGMYGKLGPQQKELLDRIKDATIRLKNLVLDVLQSSRLERGKFVINLSQAKISKIVRDVFEQIQDMAKRKSQKYSLHIQDKVKDLVITCDKDKLFEAFTNLIDNAIQYTPKGGKIDVYLYQPDNEWVVFAVKDTGIGIPKEEQHKLFSKFTRLENAKKVRPDGTGIGLYLVKQIVDGHNGRVWLHSELGKGTTFYVALPIDKNKVIKHVKGQNVEQKLNNEDNNKGLNIDNKK